MRTTSVMLVGVFTLMFGFYANTSRQSDATLLALADGRTAQVQAEMIAQSGTMVAKYYLATPSQTDGWTVTNRAIHSGTMSYAISYDIYGDPNNADVTVYGRFGGVTVTQVSHLKRTYYDLYTGWSQWVVSKSYVVPQAPATSMN